MTDGSCARKVRSVSGKPISRIGESPTDPEGNPMSVPDPPRVFFSYSHDTQDHKDQVRRFATFLRSRIGLEVVLDQWDDNHRIDWSLWATRNITAADFVVAVASPLYRARADGDAPPDEGRGAQFESALL